MQLVRGLRRRGGARQRGLSLVELMVGVTVGLFIVAAGALLASSQISDNRSLLAETQLQQDLRATADIISRDLRRTYYNDNMAGFVPKPVATGATAATDKAVSTNTFNAQYTYGSAGITYGYARSSGVGSLGLRLRDGAIQSCQDHLVLTCEEQYYQDLSDRNAVEILGFSFQPSQLGTRARPQNDDPIKLPCPNVCSNPLDPTGCWPSVQLSEMVLWITGRSRADPRVVRTLKATVRIRNPRVTMPLLDVGTGGTGPACPAPAP